MTDPKLNGCSSFDALPSQLPTSIEFVVLFVQPPISVVVARTEMAVMSGSGFIDWLQID